MTLREWLERDHRRLDEAPYQVFRGGLLRHIAIEEKILFPAIRAVHGDSELLRQLHRDHAALSALLVLPPSESVLAQIHAILREHNPLEENERGAYSLADSLPEEAAASIPELPLAPHFDTEVTRRSVDILVKAAMEVRYRLE